MRKRRAICNERNVVHRLKKKVIAPPCYPLLRDNHCHQYYTHTRTYTRATLNPRAEKLRLEKWITRIARYAIANVTARRALPLTNIKFSHSRYNEASRGETTCACVKKNKKINVKKKEIKNIFVRNGRVRQRKRLRNLLQDSLIQSILALSYLSSRV